MNTPIPGPFGYYVNLDERGDFYADVRNPVGETIFEIHAEEDGSIALIEDGFMRHKTDLDGLRAHLVDLGLIDRGAELLSSDRFEARLDTDQHEHARLERASLAALAPVEEGKTDQGAWVRVTGRDASLLATRLGETGVSRWIEKRFDGPSSEGEVMPEFYLLVDDSAAPTRAHVTLAAARESDLEAGRQVRMIAPTGHTTGYRNDNPYPEFAKAIETLARVEGLALRPNWMGRELDLSREDPSEDGPGM